MSIHDKIKMIQDDSKLCETEGGITLGCRFRIIVKTLSRHPGVIPPAAL
jgi:hypothetical protein